jgi:putative acetyltransferase
MTCKLRPYLPEDAETLAILMQASIEELAIDDYTEEQREAWCAVPADEEAFGKMLASHLTLVAMDDDGDIVGFATLVKNQAIGHVHVHPDLPTLGIGRTLVEALLKLAMARGATSIFADATDNARAFFLALGFEAKARNTINYGEEWLGATTMERILKAPETATVQ